MKKYNFTIHGNRYEVNILSVDDSIAELEVNGTPYRVEIDKPATGGITSKSPRLVDTLTIDKKQEIPQPMGTGRVTSPLPGVILEVFVKPGDEVKRGQKLISLEAMKMENNIDSDTNGRVVKVNVSKGDSVMEGDVLMEIGV